MKVQLGATTLNDLIHRRLNELLGDGKWHDLEPVIRDLSKLVPPGVAVRRNEQDRVANVRTRTGAEQPRVRPIAPEQAVRSGARAIVRAVISSHGGEPAYELRLTRGVQRVRQLRLPRQLRSDEVRAQQLRPAFNALADHFHQMGMDYAREQVQLAAHEYGFHVSSCPPGCSLTRITKTTEAALGEPG